MSRRLGTHINPSWLVIPVVSWWLCLMWLASLVFNVSLFLMLLFFYSRGAGGLLHLL